MRFAFWQALLLLPILPWLMRWAYRQAKPPYFVFSRALGTRFSKRDPRFFLLSMRGVALALMVVALARPQSSFHQQERKVSGIDILMVMDVSASMLAEDLAEKSRLDIAKDTMIRFIQGRENDRIGFVNFSGEPLTLAPPTLDYGLLTNAVKQIETGKLRDGTAIGDGLSLGVSRLKNSTAKSRIVILLTDGDNNIGQVSPADAGELAKGFGIKVYTIAIGREGPVRIPVVQKLPGGAVRKEYFTQQNALNTEILEVIAQNTGGKFYRVQDLETLEEVFGEIDQLERTDVQTREKVKYEEQFAWFLKLALFVLLLEKILARLLWRMAL